MASHTKSDHEQIEHGMVPSSGDISDQEEKPRVHDALDDDPVYTRQEQRKIIQRLDWRLITVTGIIYMNSLMDRSNLPNARIAGMNEDLEMDVGFRYVWRFLHAHTAVR